MLFPGATQTCVGPGACRGGQQCLADGTAFGPCDCGGRPRRRRRPPRRPTPASRRPGEAAAVVIKPGKLADAVAEQISSNESATGHEATFADHRARLTREIAERAPAAGGGRLCLLGAGNANDVDLDALAARFAEIHLCDIDTDAVARAIARVPAPLRAQLVAHAPLDASGMFDLLEPWSRVPPDAARAGRHRRGRGGARRARPARPVRRRGLVQPADAAAAGAAAGPRRRQPAFHRAAHRRSTARTCARWARCSRRAASRCW